MENKTTKKKTLKNYYEEIIEMATSLDNEEIVQFCKDRIEKLEHKTSGEKKMTKTQEENEGFKQILLSAMTEELQTITKLQEKTGLQDLSNQKVTALLRQLIEAEKIERVVEKRKSYFRLKIA